MIKNLESKLVNYLSSVNQLSIYNLENKINVHELIYLLVHRNEFKNIKLIDIDLNDKIPFSDDKRVILSPYFNLVRKWSIMIFKGLPP